MEITLTQLALSVERAIRSAGTLVLELRAAGLTYEHKEDGSLVSNADIACQEFLVKQITPLLPEAGFFAEEENVRTKKPYTWIIDPIDGTTNFTRGLSHFCISVALTHNDQPIIGIIYQPVLDECFVAIKGMGATLNGKTIKVSLAKKLSETLLLISFAHKTSQKAIQQLKELAPHLFSFRYFGAVALDMAYLAAGRIDAIMFEQLKWWDIAAGLLIIQEAGGKATTFTGQPITPDYPSLVAANDSIHKELRQHLQNIS